MGTLERAEKARKILLQEYFSSTSRVPELEGFLGLKDGYKKSWKKVYCILRASGLYYSLKGKQKVRMHMGGGGLRSVTNCSLFVDCQALSATGPV